MSQENICNPQPMAKWLEDEKDGECRPCRIAVILKDYQDVLKENYPDMVKELAEAIGIEGDPVLEVAKTMDGIKEKVKEEVKAALLELDCLAQNN